MKKTVVVIEHIWDFDPTPHNKDVSVLPYIDGVCRLNGYEMFYGKYISPAGFNSWLDHFKTILQSHDRRIILYLAGHGSNRTLGGKQLSNILSQVWCAANHLNIEGCILGGCFVGRNTEDMKDWMIDSKLTWMVGYKHAVDWFPSTLMDMSIISNMMACPQKALTERPALERLLINSASLFNSQVEMSTDKNGNRKMFDEAVTCIIQPRIQGQRPVSLDLF